MSRPQSTRTIRYSIPALSNGVLMSGECLIVPDQSVTPEVSGGSLVMRRQDFAAALKFWRRSDATSRRTRRQERINALILFLIRNSISR